MEDEGKYTCAAENKLGKISYDVSLYVETSECLFSFTIRSPLAREFRSILFEYIQSSSFRMYFQLSEIFILDIFHPLQSIESKKSIESKIYLCVVAKLCEINFRKPIHGFTN